MTGWDISVPGVSFVTSLVSDAIDGLDSDVKSYGTHMQSAGESAGRLSYGPAAEGTGSGAITAALNLFMEETFSDVAFLNRRSVKSVSGARIATAQYVAGSIEQAANAQEEALKAPAKVELPPADKGGEGK